MALTTDLSGYASDSYVTLEEADLYFTDHWDTTKSAAWLALTDPQKEALLRQAVSVIESLPFHEDSTESATSFYGDLKRNIVTPAVTNQKLSFPRNIDIDSLDAFYIPIDIKQAQCEQAIFLVTSMNESVVSARMRGLIAESVQAGSVSVSQSYSGVGGSSDPGQMLVSPFAYLLLKKYVVKTARSKRM